MAHTLNDFFQFLYDLFIVTIGIKLLLAHWLAEHISAWLSRTFAHTEAHQTILDHYTAHALQNGHAAGSIVACQQGACAQIG